MCLCYHQFSYLALMGKGILKPSELILNDDGSVYHLHLHRENVGDTIILVGDQDRVPRISQHFDQIDCKIRKREFVTHSGTLNQKRLTVISTGIGTDNIDIVLNELDACVNVDFATRKPKEERTSLNFVRIGTSGALHEEIPVGSFLLSEYALGLDGLVYYYDFRQRAEEQVMEERLLHHLGWDQRLAKPYLIRASDELVRLLSPDMIKGITVTATGFYGPQGRSLVFESSQTKMHDSFRTFKEGPLRITNLEMETSAIYGLSRLMGHKACTCCVILANRFTGEFVKDAQEHVDRLIEIVLERLVRE